MGITFVVHSNNKQLYLIQYYSILFKSNPIATHKRVGSLNFFQELMATLK